MRITNTMMSDQFLVDANDSLNRLAKAQQQEQSTKRISEIDDDPLATMSSLKARNKLSRIAEYQSAISSANSSLKENSSSLDGLNTIIQSAYELVSTANDGSKTQEDLSAMADEMEQMRDEVVSIANGTLGTSYLFSGDSSATPFKVDSGHLYYNGIDLSQYALKDEVSSQIDAESSAYEEINQKQGNDADSTLAMLNTSTDYQIQNVLCPKIIDTLGDLIQSGQTAEAASKKFGSTLDTSALDSALGKFSSLKEKLESANAKENGITEQISTLTTELQKLNQDPQNNAEEIQEKQQQISALQDKQGNEFNADEIRNLVNYGSSTVPSPVPADPDSLENDQNDLNQALKDILSQMNNILTTGDTAGGDSKLKNENAAVQQFQIGATQNIQTSLNGLELMGVNVTEDASGKVSTTDSNKDNLYYILDKCTSILKGDSNQGSLSEMVSTLQSAQSNVLSLNTKVGTSQNLLSSLSDRYTTSKLNYTSMKSDAEDVDMAAAIVSLTKAKTVYNAALASGAKIMQTSLIDFLS